MSPSKLFQILYTIMCCSGLLYQTYLLMAQYLRAKTVTNVEVVVKGYGHLPALTICYPYLFSMERIAHYYPEYQSDFNQYKLLLDQISTDFTFKHSKNMSNLYFRIIARLNYEMLDYIRYDELSFHSNIRHGIFILIDDNYNQNDSINVNFTRLPVEKRSMIYNGDAVESIYHNNIVKVKCFTYFSTIQLLWSNIKIDINEMFIGITNNNLWFPSTLFTQYYFSIHSSNTIPKLDYLEKLSNYKIMNANATYLLEYFYLDNKFSESEGGRFCQNYKQGEIRDDCILGCINQMLDRKYDFSYYGYSIRKEIYLKNFHANFTVDPRKLDFNERTQVIEKFTYYQSLCKEQCKRECQYSYYYFNIVKLSELKSKMVSKFSSITIKHSDKPDIVINHIIEMTFISLVLQFRWFAWYVVRYVFARYLF